MKRVYFFTLLASIVSMFCSCSSEAPAMADIEPNEKVYDVVFNIEEFRVETNPLRSTSGKYVAYRVYMQDSIVNESTGNTEPYYVQVVEEKRLTPSEFAGKISLKLPRGNYRIVAFLSEVVVGNFIKIQAVTGGNAIQYENSGIMYQDITQDIFRGEADFVVGGQNITQSLIVKRPISKINLAIDGLSQIPSSVNTIVPVIYNVKESSVGVVIPLQIFLSGRSQYFYGHTFEGQEYLYPYQKIAISKSDISLYGKDNPISFYFPQNQSYRFLNGGDYGQHDLYLIGLEDQEVNAAILTLENPKIIYSKLLKKDIQLVPNQSLTITGSLFDNSGISLSIDENWGDTISKEF